MGIGTLKDGQFAPALWYLSFLDVDSNLLLSFLESGDDDGDDDDDDDDDAGDGDGDGAGNGDGDGDDGADEDDDDDDHDHDDDNGSGDVSFEHDSPLVKSHQWNQYCMVVSNPFSL